MPFTLFPLLLYLTHITWASELTRISKGVSPRELDRFAKSLELGVFQCYDGRITIPVEQVNDDYCDCPDGSDEPGTSACSHGAGFWCPNAGFRPQSVPSSRVGDGICDCCDGSDESVQLHNHCPDTCAEKATLLAQEEAERRERIERAKSVRESAIAQGKAAQEARQLKLKELPEKLAAAEAQVEELTSALGKEEELERQEKDALIAQAKGLFYDSLKLSSLSVDALQHVLVELSLEKHEQSGEALIDQVKNVMGSQHEIDDTTVLSASLTPSQDDSPAKQALKDAEAQVAAAEAEGEAYKDDPAKIALAEQEVRLKEQAVQLAKAALEEEKVQLEKERREHLKQAIGIDTFSVAQLQDILVGVATATKQLPRLAELVKEQGGGDAAALVPDDNLSHSRPQAEEARKSLNAAKDERQRLETEKKAVEEEDAMDYGPDQEYYILKGQCFTKQAGEHSYNFCPFGTSTQGTRSLGKWAGWHKQTEWHSKYHMMKFERGDRFGCGSDRELVVNVECGDQAEVLKVEEPSMCKYSMNFVCPQACTEALA